MQQPERPIFHTHKLIIVRHIRVILQPDHLLGLIGHLALERRLLPFEEHELTLAVRAPREHAVINRRVHVRRDASATARVHVQTERNPVLATLTHVIAVVDACGLFDQQDAVVAAVQQLVLGAGLERLFVAEPFDLGVVGEDAALELGVADALVDVDVLGGGEVGGAWRFVDELGTLATVVGEVVVGEVELVVGGTGKVAWLLVEVEVKGDTVFSALADVFTFQIKRV